MPRLRFVWRLNDRAEIFAFDNQDVSDVDVPLLESRQNRNALQLSAF